MAHRLGDIVYEHYVFYASSTDLPLSGLVLADLVDLFFMRDVDTDVSNLLSMTEIGVTGEYVIQFTPDAIGIYSLMFTEPAGTYEDHQKAVYEVI